jgi:hypothetical protein
MKALKSLVHTAIGTDLERNAEVASVEENI